MEVVAAKEENIRDLIAEGRSWKGIFCQLVEAIEDGSQKEGSYRSVCACVWEYMHPEEWTVDQWIKSAVILRMRHKSLPGERLYYEAYLGSGAWKRKRENLFRRVASSCDCCGGTEELHCHHLTYANMFDEDLCDLRVLCEACHEETHRPVERDEAYDNECAGCGKTIKNCYEYCYECRYG